jgi:hypothetical protein
MRAADDINRCVQRRKRTESRPAESGETWNDMIREPLDDHATLIEVHVIINKLTMTIQRKKNPARSMTEALQFNDKTTAACCDSVPFPDDVS